MPICDRSTMTKKANPRSTMTKEAPTPTMNKEANPHPAMAQHYNDKIALPVLHRLVPPSPAQQ